MSKKTYTHWLVYLKLNDEFQNNVMGPIRAPFAMNQTQFKSFFEDIFPKYSNDILAILPSSYSKDGLPSKNPVSNFKSFINDESKLKEYFNYAINASNKFKDRTIGGHAVISVVGPDSTGSFACVVSDSSGKFHSYKISESGDTLPNFPKHDSAKFSYKLEKL